MRRPGILKILEISGALIQFIRIGCGRLYVTLLSFLLHACALCIYVVHVDMWAYSAHCRHCSKSLDEKYSKLTVIGDVYQRCVYIVLDLTERRRL
jgi:hypothetical protein